MQQGVESFFATQRILVDLAMRQNANVMKVLRERLIDPHHSPANIVAEMAGEGMANFIEAQKVLLHLAQEHNHIVMTGVKERVGNIVPAGAITDLWRRSIDTFITMQQEFLKIAGKQTHAWLEVARTGKPYKGDRLIEVAREGMERFIHAQKQFFDIIEEETAKATSGKRADGAAGKIKKTELSELATRATEAFVDAQKKLFDLAGRQINANVKAAGRAAELLKPLPFVDLADLTREGVRSYVDAQKALMDVMLKPHNAHKREAKPERRKRRPARLVRGEVVPPVRAAAV
jgi:hypothetical protein